MAKLIYSSRAGADLNRLEDFAPGARHLILGAITVLAVHPFVGPIVDAGSRQRRLVISRGKSGYIATYRYDERADEVVVASIRHQREAPSEL